jgi:hypothetical protein
MHGLATGLVTAPTVAVPAAGSRPDNALPDAWGPLVCAISSGPLTRAMRLRAWG